MILLLSDCGNQNFTIVILEPAINVQLSDLCQLLSCNCHTYANYDFKIYILAPIMILQLLYLRPL